MSHLKALLKTQLRRLLLPILRALQRSIGPEFHNEPVAQKVLMQQYHLLASMGKQHLPNIRDVGFRKYSQFEEDGILLFLFALIAPINRTCVEICAGCGRESMTANLIINHGWCGHLFDGDERNVLAGVEFFSQNKDTWLHPPRFNRAWITAENVDEHVRNSGVSGPIDLLCLDVDGMDYCIWKALTAIEPQVVVCETHNVVPPGLALTVPYDPEFVATTKDYHGASLAAMCKLGHEKGYRLVGGHRFGFNVFFLKKGVGEDFFPEVDPSSCVDDPYSVTARNERWPKVRDMVWHEV